MEVFEKLLNEELTDKLAEGVTLEDIVSTIDEKLRKVIPLHFMKKEDYNAKNEELKAANEQLDSMQAKVDEALAGGEDAEKLKAEAEKWKTDFETFKADTEKREQFNHKKYIVEKKLADSGAANDAIDLLTTQVDIESIVLDSKDNIVDWEDKYLGPLKESRKSLFTKIKTNHNGDQGSGGSDDDDEEETIESLMKKKGLKAFNQR